MLLVLLHGLHAIDLYLPPIILGKWFSSVACTVMNEANSTWDLLLKVSRSGLYVVLSKDNLQSGRHR